MWNALSHPSQNRSTFSFSALEQISQNIQFWHFQYSCIFSLSPIGFETQYGWKLSQQMMQLRKSSALPNDPQRRQASLNASSGISNENLIGFLYSCLVSSSSQLVLESRSSLVVMVPKIGSS